MNNKKHFPKAKARARKQEEAQRRAINQVKKARAEAEAKKAAPSKMSLKGLLGKSNQLPSNT